MQHPARPTILDIESSRPLGNEQYVIWQMDWRIFLGSEERNEREKEQKIFIDISSCKQQRGGERKGIRRDHLCTIFFLQWSAVRVTPSGNPRDLNFSRTVAGITKWFWVTLEGYLSYLLPKFEDLIPTSLGDIAI